MAWNSYSLLLESWFKAPFGYENAKTYHVAAKM
jgi:hypothetical protein